MREFPRALAMIESALQIWPNDTKLLGEKAYATLFKRVVSSMKRGRF